MWVYSKGACPDEGAFCFLVDPLERAMRAIA